MGFFLSGYPVTSSLSKANNADGEGKGPIGRRSRDRGEVMSFHKITPVKQTRKAAAKPAVKPAAKKKAAPRHAAPKRPVGHK
jgi:hypothetical protein